MVNFTTSAWMPDGVIRPAPWEPRKVWFGHHTRVSTTRNQCRRACVQVGTEAPVPKVRRADVQEDRSRLHGIALSPSSEKAHRPMSWCKEASAGRRHTEVGRSHSFSSSGEAVMTTTRRRPCSWARRRRRHLKPKRAIRHGTEIEWPIVANVLDDDASREHSETHHDRLGYR